MAERYIALAEETNWRSAGSTWMYFKLLNESIVTERNDFFPETVERWVPEDYAEGWYATSGDFEVLVEPIMWPKLLVLFMEDGSSSSINGTEYEHTFTMGDQESTGATEIKAFTTAIGTGLEKDRQIEGNVIESMTIECVNQELVSSTISIVGSGKESLITAKDPSYSNYTQPYFTFADTTTMTVGGTDRLDTDPTIESFTIELTRGYDTDHYVLGDEYWAYPKLDGYAEVSGSAEFSWQSQDEYERFMDTVGSTSMDSQNSFETILTLQGVSMGTNPYEIRYKIPAMRYTSSEISVSARDRVIQAVDWRGSYDSSTSGAVEIKVQNITDSYTDLS